MCAADGRPRSGRARCVPLERRSACGRALPPGSRPWRPAPLPGAQVGPDGPGRRRRAHRRHHRGRNRARASHGASDSYTDTEQRSSSRPNSIHSACRYARALSLSPERSPPRSVTRPLSLSVPVSDRTVTTVPGSLPGWRPDEARRPRCPAGGRVLPAAAHSVHGHGHGSHDRLVTSGPGGVRTRSESRAEAGHNQNNHLKK
jgi:hypothetical protein